MNNERDTDKVNERKYALSKQEEWNSRRGSHAVDKAETCLMYTSCNALAWE